MERRRRARRDAESKEAVRMGMESFTGTKDRNY
jgi:hypothetical protein